MSLYARALVKYLNAANLAPTDLAKPELDRFAPATSDLSFTGVRGGGMTVGYKNRLSMYLLPEVGNVQKLVFKR